MKSQYGLVRMLNTGRYSGQAMAIPTTIASTEMINRVRSSSRCSTSVMLPSGLRRWRRFRINATGPPFRARKPCSNLGCLREGARIRRARLGVLDRRPVAVGVAHVPLQLRSLSRGRRGVGEDLGLGLVVKMEAQLLADVFRGPAELPKGFADGSPDLGEAFRTEDDQGNDQDQDDLFRADVEQSGLPVDEIRARRLPADSSTRGLVESFPDRLQALLGPSPVAGDPRGSGPNIALETSERPGEQSKLPKQAQREDDQHTGRTEAEDNDHQYRQHDRRISSGPRRGPSREEDQPRGRSRSNRASSFSR